jgi:hypothetical protein
MIRCCRRRAVPRAGPPSVLAVRRASTTGRRHAPPGGPSPGRCAALPNELSRKTIMHHILISLAASQGRARARLHEASRGVGPRRAHRLAVAPRISKPLFSCAAHLDDAPRRGSTARVYGLPLIPERVRNRPCRADRRACSCVGATDGEGQLARGARKYGRRGSRSELESAAAMAAR